MGGWQLLTVGLVLLLGLLGVLAPGVPGPPIVWAGVLWWAMAERSTLAWCVLIGTSAVLLLAQVLAWLLPPRDPGPPVPRTGPCTSAAPRASSASSWCPWWEPRWARSARST